MNISNLNTLFANRGGKVPTRQVRVPSPANQKKPSVNREQTKIILDKMIRNTRFQYIIKDELAYFVVRIIDKDTDKVIKEIPSKELQKLHENIEEALGLLFDKEI